MKKIIQNIFLLFILLVIVSGCSTEKNTWVSRTYHNVTSHYNVYFNGKESLKTGVNKINNSVEDDFTELLPIYKSSQPGTEQVSSADMETAILKASKLINIHSITQKPKRRGNRSEAYKRLASKEEYNNWIDDSYILMGKAYFYQKNYVSALDNFSYVVRKFSEEESKYEAYVWMIRSYTEFERYNDALEIIQNIDATEAFPQHLDESFSLAVADFHIRLREYDDAIPQLKVAIERSHRKENKIRYKYILAQLYQETGKNELASSTFREISKMNPTYVMAFNARINAADAFTGNADGEKLKKELRKMLRDDKNIEYQDQIYFALGNIFSKEGNKKTAIDNYIKSVANSSINTYQRALSCLTLADIYFDEQNYKGSQSYYDSAMVVIDTEYPNYTSISERYSSLTRLTDNLYTIELEDSLQRIALLSETERDDQISQWIEEAREEELRQQQALALNQSNSSYYRANQSRLGLSQQNSGSGWYFYNTTTSTYGKVEFKQIWGERKLEDNWRRKNKNSSDTTIDLVEDDSTNAERTTTDEPKVTKIDDRLSREYYTQDLPMTEEAMKTSHLKIRDALFNAGRIFEQDFENYERAIESYEDLLLRYENNTYQLITYFELWDLHTQIGNTERSDYYRNLIINNFPESKYAKYLINPNYFIELEARNDSLNNLYQQAFYNYKQGQYANAGAISRQIMSMDPDSVLLPKVAFINTISEGTQTDLDQFGKGLENYIKTYPESPTKPLAESIYNLIQDSTLVNYQQLVAMGYLNEEIQNEEILLEDQAETDEFGGKFSYDEDLLHYFVIAYPRSANIDINRLKFDIANYNIDHYTKIDFDLETENLNSQTSLLIVRSLENKEQSLIYFRSIIRNREVFETLDDVDYLNMVASSYNYREILSDNNYTDYLKFFIKNYSRFIGSDFPEDELPEPEELMAKAQEEENQLEERGTFVVVKAETGKASFQRDNEASQNFVIAVNDPTFDLRNLMPDFTSYNRSNFDDYNLTMQQRSVGEYKLLVIKPLTNIRQAVVYFRQVVATRRLFKELETRSYRNFIITDDNLEKLVENAEMDNYMDFFRNYYISGEFEGSASEPAKTEITQTSVAPAATRVEIPEYEGSYKTEITGDHYFTLVIPREEINSESVKTAVEIFNQQTYSSLSLSTEQTALDAQNNLIKVSGFESKEVAMQYLRSIVRNNQVYGILTEVNYRNFIISKENYSIFTENKNISEYLEMYKAYYLTP